MKVWFDKLPGARKGEGAAKARKRSKKALGGWKPPAKKGGSKQRKYGAPYDKPRG